MMPLPELGVGVIYSAGLEPLLEAEPELINVVELEPQTSWRYAPDCQDVYELDSELIGRLKALPQSKLVHGVGFPVGGSIPPDPRHLPPLIETVTQLGAPWASEHLGFNRVHGLEGDFNTGFLLPPLHTPAGAAAAIESVTAVSSALPVPFAIETGVNYLQTRPGDLADGVFAARVATGADVGILLDLHNLWANELNGRQGLEDFLMDLPLERVWEVHIAGGLEREGYWLDAHSGKIPDPLVEIATRVIPALPSLRAIIFELVPAFLPRLGFDGVLRELEKLHRVWERRSSRSDATPGRARDSTSIDSRGDVTPIEWERDLGALVIGRPPTSPLASTLAEDPGVEMLRELVWEFRAGMIVDTLNLTCQLLFTQCGEKEVRGLLGAFFAQTPPELFGSAEADAFATFLQSRRLDVPYLTEVLGFEQATMRVLMDGKSRTVSFGYEPMALLDAVRDGRVPAGLQEGSYEIEITPDGEAANAARGRVLTTT